MPQEVKVQNTEKDTHINSIIEKEWEMFGRVINEGGRADCQDDHQTFYIMRYSQHNAFSLEALVSYGNDLDQALSQGRNLLTEKYAYMMEYTDPKYYEANLKPYLPPVSSEKQALIQEIERLMIAQQQRFAVQYPIFSSKGRPLLKNEGAVSIHIYQMGELKTYTIETLQLYLRDIKAAESQGKDIVMDIHKKTAEFYGYTSLMEAEDTLK